MAQLRQISYDEIDAPDFTATDKEYIGKILDVIEKAGGLIENVEMSSAEWFDFESACSWFQSRIIALPE